jgi:hypothetical protein
VVPVFPIADAARIQNLYAAALFRRYLLGYIDYAPYLTQSYALTREPHVVFFGPEGASLVPAFGAVGHGALIVVLVGAATLARRHRSSLATWPPKAS